MLFVIKQIGSILFLFMIASCSRELSHNPNGADNNPVGQLIQSPEPSALPKSDQQAKPSDVTTYDVTETSFTITGDEEPHLYQVQVKWPKKQNPVLVLLDELLLARVLPKETNAFTFKAQDRRSYVVELKEEIDGIQKTIDARKLEVPTDYVFSSTEVLNKDTVTKANRIFFKKFAQIETGKFNFTLEANDIFFEDGVKISNFLNLPKTPNQTAGLDGGTILIKGNVGHGKIQIDLSGSDGGKGMEAFSWVVPHAPGKDGVAGNCKRGEGNSFAPPICREQPIDGENGPDGLKGKSGFQGARGGNSGSLIVEFSDQSEVEIVHESKPGQGGPGGDGGIGQMKGRPGKAAPREENCSCPQGKDGQDTGKDGEQGLQGPKGEDGKLGTICISIGKGANQCVK